MHSPLRVSQPCPDRAPIALNLHQAPLIASPPLMAQPKPCAGNLQSAELKLTHERIVASELLLSPGAASSAGMFPSSSASVAYQAYLLYPRSQTEVNALARTRVL